MGVVVSLDPMLFKVVNASTHISGHFIDANMGPFIFDDNFTFVSTGCWREMKELVHNFLFLSQNLDTSPEARTV